MGSKLILFGSGEIGCKWLEHLGGEAVYSFADSNLNKIGKSINNKRILSIDELQRMRDEIAIFISTAYENKNEIIQILREKGLEENIIGNPNVNKEVYIDLRTQVDPESKFEGKNALLKGVKLNKCKMGYASYISVNSVLDGVKIGRYTSIGPNVRVIRGQHPTRMFVSTHPMFYSTQQTIHKTYVDKNIFEEYKNTSNGYSVEIGNDVWIGDGATIMEGIRIADGTIVAAGANVVKDTEPYSIVGGNPARTIRFRFEREDIKFLQELKWWNKSQEWIDAHADYFRDIKKLKEKCYAEN